MRTTAIMIQQFMIGSPFAIHGGDDDEGDNNDKDNDDVHNGDNVIIIFLYI